MWVSEWKCGCERGGYRQFNSISKGFFFFKCIVPNDKSENKERRTIQWQGKEGRRNLKMSQIKQINRTKTLLICNKLNWLTKGNVENKSSA